MAPPDQQGWRDENDILTLVQALASAATRLRDVRDEFQPIYTYYFPQSWLAALALWIRLRPQPDFSRFRTELRALRERTWQIVGDAKRAYGEIAKGDSPFPLKKWAELAYRQVYLDGSVILIFNEYIKRMDEHDPEAGRYFMSMIQFSKEAQANLVALRAAAHAAASDLARL